MKTVLATADTCYLSKAKDPEKSTKSAGIPAKSRRKKTDVECHVCGVVGHYARDCSLRKSNKTVEKAHVTRRHQDSDDDEDESEELDIVMVASECCLFSRNELLLDNQASVNVFGNVNLLKNVRKAAKPISLSGI